MANRSTWVQRVAEWKASGLTAAAYAQPRGWAPTTLKWWSSRLNQSALPAGPVTRFVQLVPAAEPPGRVATRQPPPIVVELRGARLVLPSGFDRGDLAAVLDLVRPRGGKS